MTSRKCVAALLAGCLGLVAPTFATSRPTNPLFPMLFLLKQLYPNLEISSTDRTGGPLSMVVAFNTPLKLQALSGLVASYTRAGNLQDPPACPDAQIADPFAPLHCCFTGTNSIVTGISADCLTKFQWSGLDPIGQGLMKYGLDLGTLFALAREISRSSFALDIDWLKATNEMPPDQLVYIWLDRKLDDRHYLATRVDADLAARISLTLHMLLPRFYEAAGMSEQPQDAFLCDENGLTPADISRVSIVEPIKVSLGSNVDLVAPAALKGSYGASVFVYATGSGTGIRFEEKTSPAIVGSDSSWMSFARGMEPGHNYFPCLDPRGGISRLFSKNPEMARPINSPEASSFLFFGMYLAGAYDEIQRAASTAQSMPIDGSKMPDLCKQLRDALPFPGFLKPTCR